VRPLPWDEFVAGNAGNVVVAWRRWASDWPGWFQAVWLIGIGVAVVLHRRVARTRVPLVAGFALGASRCSWFSASCPPRGSGFSCSHLRGHGGAAGVLALLGPAMARPRVRERTWRWVAVGSALLLLAGGALSVQGRSRQYRYNLAEYPGAERAVTFLVPRLLPGDRVLVLGMSQTPFLYYARRNGLPYLSYVYDYLLEGWRPLRDAARVFIVVLDPQRTLDDVVTEAQLKDAGTPVPIAQFAAAEIYLVGRE
jgi:hypothetical protein